MSLDVCAYIACPREYCQVNNATTTYIIKTNEVYIYSSISKKLHAVYMFTMDMLYVVVSTILLVGGVQSYGSDTTLLDFYSYQQVLLLKLLNMEIQNISSCTCDPHFMDEVPMLPTAMQGLREEYALSSCNDLSHGAPSRFYYVTTPVTPPKYMYCVIARAFGYYYYGNWLRVAQLDMRDPTHKCPSGFKTTTPVVSTGRYCTRKADGCSSHYYPVYGYSYQTVCGKVIAYQEGKPDAFYPSSSTYQTIDDVYVDGVSITHGSSRNHIWTFAAAMHEDLSFMRHLCPCTNSRSPQNNNIFIPSFVGENYFCDTGCASTAIPKQFYGNNPLWDGNGCGEFHECCDRQESQEYFCTVLPAPTTNAIEVRICADQKDEQIHLQQLELFVK